MLVYYDTATSLYATLNCHAYTQFECLNELKDTSSRCYDNLLHMNRFVFECDTIDKNIQEERAIKLVNDGIACRAVDSGNKSIHVIIELDKDASSVEEYKLIWHMLNKKYFNAEADTACSNPNRLTRRPGAIRMSNGVEQKLIAQSEAKYILDKYDLESIKSELQRVRLLDTIRQSSISKSVLDNNGICKNWNIITRYINTPFPKMTGNVNSAKWLYAAVKTCQKYKDNTTLELVLNKARNEHWSEKEIARILR